MAGDSPGDRPQAGAETARLDPTSRLHLRIFAFHLGLVTTLTLPVLVLQPRGLAGLLAHLAMLFTVSALSLSVLALLSGHRMLRRSLGLWDEVLAMIALSLGCSIVLRLTA